MKLQVLGLIQIGTILTNGMLDKLNTGDDRIQLKMVLKDGGESLTQNLTSCQSMTYGFIEDYQDTIAGIAKHSVNDKAIRFTEGFGQVILNSTQGENQVNVLNSRINADGDNVADIWIASNEYDYQNEHTKYLVIKTKEDKEVYNKKAPTWNIKKSFAKQVKIELGNSGVQVTIPKKYRNDLFTKEIHVKDNKDQIQVVALISSEVLK